MNSADPAARFIPDSIPCAVYAFGGLSAGARIPLFMMPAASDVSDLIQGLRMRLDPALDAGLARPFMLAVFEVPNWEDALSPWPAPGFGRNSPGFQGGAQATLDWIAARLIPAIEERFTQVRGGPRGLLGYSMAGLFALWAVHQTSAFTLCASCSGSLWYDGFTDYLGQNAPKAACLVYLSLGENEEKARNRRFARVGEATRRAAALMEASAFVKETVMVWHPGGHTGSVGERLAHALLWLARHSRTDV